MDETHTIEEELEEVEEEKEDERDHEEHKSAVYIEDGATNDVAKQATIFQIIYSILGLIIGALVIGMGGFLIYSGTTSPDPYSMSFLEVEISGAPAGIVTLVIGAMVVYFTRYSVRVKS